MIRNMIEKNKIMENYDSSDNLSVIFNKKTKKAVIKDLVHITNDMGVTRHYTPAAQE